MRKPVSNPPKRSAGRWLAAGGLAVVAAVAGLALLTRSDEPAPRPLSRLEREASARFAGAPLYVSLPNGKRLEPTNEAHRLQMKVNAYQHILANEAEKRDPTFHLKAEAELERRRPLQAAIEWNDVTGNREMDFMIEDSSACGLDGKIELSFAADAVTHYPCLAQGGQFWDKGTQLSVHLTPVTREDRLWGELLFSTKKAMATADHLASAEPNQGS
jgi:hypothetical protein